MDQCEFELNTGKYGPEITPYLNSFHAVLILTIPKLPTPAGSS